MSVGEWVTKSVAFVGYIEGDLFHPEGTGFFVSWRAAGKVFFYLVTAQHVYTKIQGKNADRVCVRTNTATGVEYLKFRFDSFYFHPDAGRYVDVVAVPYPAMSGEPDIATISLPEEAATKEFLKEHDIGIGDEICFPGYFSYHVGQERNIPIVRTGNIAAMSSEPVSGKSGPENVYFAEARSIGGLSGSPVFLNMSPVRIVGNESRMYEGFRHPIIGVMKGHFFEHDEDGKNEKLNVGVGLVVPIDEVIELMKSDDMEQQRQELIRSIEERAENIEEDSAPAQSVDELRDKTLETMLNTPPKPRD